MAGCNTGRNIQKYKGAAASTLQDVTDNGNTTTGDIITTSGFFIGDGSKLSGIAGASSAFTLQETSDRGNTTSNTIQFTNPITSLTTSGNVIVAGNVTAFKFYGSGSGLTTLNASNISSGKLSNDRLDKTTGSGNIVMSTSPTLSGTITGGTFSGIHIGTGSGLTTLNASNISSGTLIISRGGTNITTYAKGDILIASDTNTLSNLCLGTGGYVLTSNSTTGLPEWRSSSDLGTEVAQLSNSSYILGGVYNGITQTTWSVQASTSNTSNYIVSRDTKGDIFVSNVNAIQYYGDGGTLSNITGTQDLQEVITRGSYTNSPPYFGAGSYGAIYGSNTINASTISTATGFYGPIKGSNTIIAGTISTATGFYGPIKGSNTIIGTTLNVNNLISDDASAINRLNASNVNTGTLSIDRGGTNITTYVKGDILIASDTNTLSNLSLGADSYVLSSNSTTGLPEWKSPGSIGATVATLSNGSYINGGVYNGGSEKTWDIDATTTNTVDKIVARDNTGNINVQKVTVGTDNGIINTLTATAWSGSAAKLTTARTIGGVSFDGSININLPGVNTPGDQNTSGSADKINVVDSASTSSLRVPFLQTDTGDVSVSSSDTLKYQASTGTLSSTIFNGSGSGLTSLNASNITSGKLSNIYGGTGFTTYTKGDLLVGTGFSPNGLRKLPIGTTAGYVLTINDSGTDIEWKETTGGSSGGGYWTQYLSNIYYNVGNVGIGTNAPEYKLDIDGDINLTGFLHVNGSQGSIGQVLTSSGDGTMTWSTLSSMGGTSVWSTNCLNAYYNRGNIGVGTTNPIYKLHVVGNMKITSGLSVNNSYGQSGQVLTSSGGGPMSWTTISSGTTVSSDWLKNNSNIYYTAGSVGIGTSNPNYRLDVSGDIGLSGKIYSSDDATAQFGFINSSTSSGDDFVVTTNTFERMRVISSGNVGIGKSDPDYTLDVAGDINFTNALRVNGSVGTSGQVLTSGGSEGATIWVFPDWKKNNSNIYYTTGNVGIGTSNPQYKLDVSGNMNLTSGLRVNNSYGESGQVLTSGGGGQMSWTTVSGGGSSVWTKNDTTAYYNTGNVAIGTTVANYTLNVAGNMNLTSGLRVNNSYGESGQVLTSSGGGTMSWTTVSGGGTSIWTLNGTNAYYNNGNVGIGKTNPEYKLHVVGDINFTNALRVNGSAGTSGQILTSGGGGPMSWTSSPQFTQINLGSTTITQSEPGVIQFGGETVRTGDVSLGTETSGNYVATITGGDGIKSTENALGEGTTHTLSVDIKSNGGLIIESQKLVVDLGATAMSGILTNTSGGTGFTTYNQGDLLVGTSSNGLEKLQKGTTNFVLTVTESGIEWQAPPTGENISINGNFVGISNVSPTHTLHIGSNVIVSDTGMDVLRVNGNVYTTNYFVGDGSKLSGMLSITNENNTDVVVSGDGIAQPSRYERYAQIP
jgi:hypothetical protein